MFHSADSLVLKLISFKLCAVLLPGEMTSGRIGTSKFMAPEALRGEYNHRCDMWSAGVVMYLLLGGALPFDSSTQEGVFKRLLPEGSN